MSESFIGPTIPPASLAPGEPGVLEADRKLGEHWHGAPPVPKGVSPIKQRPVINRAKAFIAYYELGEDRSLSKLHPVLIERYPGKAPSLVRLHQWAKEDDWYQRCRGWDEQGMARAAERAAQDATDLVCQHIDQLGLVARDLVSTVQTMLTGGSPVDVADLVDGEVDRRAFFRRAGVPYIPAIQFKGSAQEARHLLDVALKIGKHLGTFAKAGQAEPGKGDGVVLEGETLDRLASRLERAASRTRSIAASKDVAGRADPPGGQTPNGSHRAPTTVPPPPSIAAKPRSSA